MDRRKGNYLFIVLAVISVLLPFLIGEFYLYLLRLIGVYAIMLLGLNLFMGYCGQINLGVGGFFCMGAYFPTILQAKLGWHYLSAFPVSLAISCLVGWGMSWPLLRLRGHSMAIGTFAFAVVVNLIFERQPTLTGGSDGIIVPEMVLFGKRLGNVFYYYLILIFVVAAYFFCHFLVNSRRGRALKAIRDNEVAAAAIGVDVNHYKTLAWLISCVLATIAGSFYAQQAGFISPDTFSMWVNILAVVMLCVGGPATSLGPILGAAIMTVLPYLLITVQTYTVLMQGLILLVVLRFVPDGVMGIIDKHLIRRGGKGNG